MKKIVACILMTALGLSHQSLARNYYIANSGNDDLDGSSPQKAFKTISRLNAQTLQPGDSVLFQRGDLFRGNLEIRNSGNNTAPITISAYGTGKSPIISGAQNLGSWQLQDNGSFTAPCNDCPKELNQIYVAEKQHIPARFPNKGYLQMKAVKDTAFDCSGLTQAHVWDSAYMHVRTAHWIIDRFKVKSQTANHISYIKPNSYYKSVALQEHFGFFLSNKIAALDTAGEWYFDAKTKMIHLIPLQASQLALGAEVSIHKNCIWIAPSVQYLHIENLQMEKSHEDAIFMDQTQYVTIQNCIIKQAGRDGIGAFENYTTSNTGVTIRGCTISDINNTGINMPNAKSMRIENNMVRRCGLVPGLGQYYDQGYEGIYCNNAVVRHNKVDSVGYIGIHFVDNDTLMYNVISNTGLTKNDCGAMYCWKGSYNYVARNFAFNGYSNGEGTTYPNNTLNFGIYCDDYSHDNIYEYNTSFNHEVGLMIHNSANITVRNNVLYNNTKAQIQMLEGAPYSGKIEVHDNVIEDNVMQCMHPSQISLLLSSEKNNLGSMATFKNNHYGNSFNKYHIGVLYRPIKEDLMYSSRYTAYSLEDFKNTFGTDTQGSEAIDAPLTYANILKRGTNMIANSSFEQNTGWWWIYDDAGKFSLSSVSNGPSGMRNKVLKGTYTDSTGIQQGNWGISPLSIKKGKRYMLTYQVAGHKQGGFRLNINSSSAPYSGLTLPSSYYRPLELQTRNDTILTLGNADDNASLTFNSTNQDGGFWMDNVQFHEIDEDTTLSTPFLNTVLFQNPSDNYKMLEVAEQYCSINGTFITQNLTLPPFGSIVLKKKDSFINSSGETLKSIQNWQLFPNPTKDKLFLQKSHAQGEAMVVISDMNSIELYSGLYTDEGVPIPQHWPNGIYLLQIKEANNHTVQKFVLER